MNDDWIPCGEKQPVEADGDKNGKILVWHAFQGVMLTRWDRLMENRFHAYWMPILPETKDKWILRGTRLPTAADADACGCVLVWDCHEGNRITGWHQPASDGGITAWQRLPGPPSDYQSLMKMQ